MARKTLIVVYGMGQHRAGSFGADINRVETLLSGDVFFNTHGLDVLLYHDTFPSELLRLRVAKVPELQRRADQPRTIQMSGQQKFLSANRRSRCSRGTVVGFPCKHSGHSVDCNFTLLQLWSWVGRSTGTSIQVAG